MRHECSECREPLSCPRCQGIDLARKGLTRSKIGRRRIYLCNDCERYITKPICKCNIDKAATPRTLSLSGTRCLTCGSGLAYCPSCGELGSHRYGFYMIKGEMRQNYRCIFCNRFTVYPNCNCVSDNMSARARAERDLRVKAKARRTIEEE